MESFGFCFFVRDVISEVGLGLFGRGHQTVGANTKRQFLTQTFSGNQAIIRVFRALD